MDLKFKSPVALGVRFSLPNFFFNFFEKLQLIHDKMGGFDIAPTIIHINRF